MSIPAGGSATFHGILYQMLWSLLEAFTLQIEDCDSDSTGESATQAFLVLEPQGGGGDLLVQDRDAEIVQQLKARSDAGAWSLREIVSDVLPDLYRAVKLGRAQRFVFITEGHMGDWKQVHDFFQSLKEKSPPEEGQNVLPLLDNSRQVSFRGSLAAKEDANLDLDEKNASSDLDEEALFAQIAEVLRKKQPARDEDVRLNHRKLWKLLANLEFQWEKATNPLRNQLQQRLRAVIDAADLRQDSEYTFGIARASGQSWECAHSDCRVPRRKWTASAFADQLAPAGDTQPRRAGSAAATFSLSAGRRHPLASFGRSTPALNPG